MNYKIPCGFHKEETTITMNLNEAYQILLTDKRYEYIELINKNGEAKLLQHILTCPHCGNRFVASVHNTPKSEIVNSDISNWLIGQLSLFEEEEQRVSFWTDDKKYKYVCQRCGHRGTASEDFRTVSVCSDNLGIKVTCELNTPLEAVSFTDCDLEFSKNCFPLYETIEFDLEKNFVTVYMKDVKNITLACKDITKEYQQYSSGVLLDLLTKNTKIKSDIKQLFEEHWDIEFPFQENELCVEKYITLTTFVGYPRSFYDAIPYEIDSLQISESFEFDKRLKHSSEIVKTYKNSGLPDVKSVRRIFFKNPGLFFYAKECKILWDIIADVNLFCQVLSGNRICAVLYNLHTYPGTIVFYSDYCNIKGVKKLCSLLLNEDLKILSTKAIEYYAMNNWQKEKEHQKWIQNRDYFNPYQQNATFDFSVLMNIGEMPIESTVVDGFRFALLHTFKEYAEAGKNLRNCLATWKPNENPVVAIYKNNYIIAAVELKGNEVLQVRYAENKNIKNDEVLTNAFKKWCKIYDFVYETYVLD